MTNLSPSAKSALDRVARAHTAYKVARDKMYAELEAELEVKLSSYTTERNTAVKLADLAGVPRTQIGKALGTSNYRTVQDLLEEAEATVSVSEGENNNWFVTSCGDGTYDLTITDLGATGITGAANIRVNGTDIEFVDGDPFVVPQVYRNNIAPEVLRAIG